jgi:hypothetical protein
VKRFGANATRQRGPESALASRIASVLADSNASPAAAAAVPSKSTTRSMSSGAAHASSANEGTQLSAISSSSPLPRPAPVPTAISASRSPSSSRVQRVWILARAPLAAHLAWALYRTAVSMLVVAVAFRALLPPSTIYYAGIVGVIVVYTLVVTLLAVWQNDFVLPMVRWSVHLSST